VFGLPPIYSALLTGFFAGLIISIPVGPINMTILNEGARRGFRWAALIAAGATVMEVIYCGLAFTSFASMLRGGVVQVAMEIFGFAFMLFLGVRYVMAKTVTVVERIEQNIEQRIEEKLHPHSAFMIGFVRTLGNLGIPILWIFLNTTFIARDWVTPDLEGKVSYLAGVGGGVAIWLLGLAWGISFKHQKISEASMLKMERISGAVLIAFAMAQGIYLAYKFSKHMDKLERLQP
jgi:threonine/homoserine/homoserine lactone efflux protein